MARIKLLEPSELDSELKARLNGNHNNDIVIRAYGHRPDLLKEWLGFYNHLRNEGIVDVKLKELARLKIAELNDCDF